MIQKMFTIYDEKADAFLPPFFLPTNGMALRTFADCVNDDKHAFGKNPQDYTLFSVGNFDDGTGRTFIENANKSLGNGVEFLSSPSQDPGLDHGPKGEIFEETVDNDAPILPSTQGGNSAQ